MTLNKISTKMRWGTLFALSALSLSACGGGPAKSAAGDTVKLLTFASVSSTLQNYPDIEAGAKAAVEAINKAGGVKGKMIEWKFCNTESDPNKASGCARQAQTDGVAAVVGHADNFSAASLPILEKAGIPSVGFQSFGNPVDWKSPVAYPISGGTVGAYNAAPHAAKQKGAKTLAVLYTDVPAAVSEAKMVEQATVAAGLKYVGNIPVPTTGVTDYAPYVQKIKDMGAEAVVLIAGPGTTTGVFNASGSLGVDPLWFHNAYSFGEAEGKSTGAINKKMIVIGPYPTFRETGVKAIQKFNAEMDAAGIGNDPTLRRSSAINAWLSVYAVAEVAKTIDGDVTAASLTKALNSAKDVDLNGLVTWSPSKLGEGLDFPRYPGTTAERFLEFVDGKLVDAKLSPMENPFHGIIPSAS